MLFRTFTPPVFHNPRFGGKPVKFLSSSQASTYLADRGVNLHPKTISRWAREGKIATHKIGRYLRFAPEDLDQFIEDCRVESEAQRESGVDQRAAEIKRLYCPKPGLSRHDLEEKLKREFEAEGIPSD